MIRPTWWNDEVPVWSAQKQTVDFDIVLAAVPEKDREAVRTHLDGCGSEGMREAWTFMHSAQIDPRRIRLLAKELRAAALGPHENTCVACKERRAVATNVDGHSFCAACVNPFDRMTVSDEHGRELREICGQVGWNIDDVLESLRERAREEAEEDARPRSVGTQAAAE